MDDNNAWENRRAKNKAGRGNSKLGEWRWRLAANTVSQKSEDKEWPMREARSKSNKEE